MSHHNNTSSPLTETTENTLILDKKEKPDLFTKISNEILLQIGSEKFSYFEFSIYAIINGFCGAQGVCYITNAALETQFPHINGLTLRRACLKMEKNGFLMRLHHPFPQRGSRRFIITRCFYEKAIKYFRKQGNLKWAAKTASFFDGVDFEVAYEYQKQIQDKRFPCTKMTPNDRSLECAPDDHSGECAPDDHSNINSNTINIRTTDGDDLDAPLFSDLKTSLNVKEMALAKEYYLTFTKVLAAKDNPAAAIIHAIKNAYAQEKINEASKVKKVEEETKKTKDLSNKKVDNPKDLCDRFKQTTKKYSVSLGVTRIGMFTHSRNFLGEMAYDDNALAGWLLKLAEKEGNAVWIQSLEKWS